MSSVEIPRETVEKLDVDVEANTDPTSGAVSFALVQGDDRPASWTAGTWATRWRRERVVARTPTIGGTGTGASFAVAVGEWKLYVKVVLAGESIVRQAGTVTIT